GGSSLILSGAEEPGPGVDRSLLPFRERPGHGKAVCFRYLDEEREGCTQVGGNVRRQRRLGNREDAPQHPVARVGNVDLHERRLRTASAQSRVEGPCGDRRPGEGGETLAQVSGPL